MKIKQVFFDLDGTLTESRRVISPEMISALKSLKSSGRSIIVITGAQIDRATLQLSSIFHEVILMTQCGNACAHWENKITPKHRDVILQHIYSIKTKHPYLFEEVNHDDLVEERGCEITFSLVGHHSPLDEKKRFDMHGSRRRDILRDIPFVSSDIQIQVGGTTCFDYVLKTKGQNLKDLLSLNKWTKEECLYVGDALYENGNDASVIGIMETKITEGPQDTLKIIKDILKDK